MISKEKRHRLSQSTAVRLETQVHQRFRSLSSQRESQS